MKIRIVDHKVLHYHPQRQEKMEAPQCKKQVATEIKLHIWLDCSSCVRPSSTVGTT